MGYIKYDTFLGDVPPTSTVENVQTGFMTELVQFMIKRLQHGLCSEKLDLVSYSLKSVSRRLI